MPTRLLLIAIAGAAGTLARYGLTSLTGRVAGDRFPWGTLAVNCLGSLLFGLVWSWTENHIEAARTVRLVVLTGFMGAFTTFSTYAFDNSQLMRSGQWLAAALNLVGSNTAGIACVLAGLALGQWLSKLA